MLKWATKMIKLPLSTLRRHIEGEDMAICGQHHAPVVVPPGKKHRYPFNTRLGGPQSRSERFGEDKNLVSLPGFEPRIIQLVTLAVPTERAIVAPF